MFRRFPCVRQVDGSDCGAAALATIALHYKRPVHLQKLRDLAGTDRVGTNLLGLVQAAEQLGFSAKGVKGPYEALPTVPLPAVAHVVNDEGLGHFVVLHRVRKNSVLVADPGRGLRKLSREEFCQTWSGALLLLVPDDTKTLERKIDKPVAPWRRFAGMLCWNRRVLVEAFVCALLMTLLGMSTGYFVQHLVDGVLVRGESRLLDALAIGMIAIALFRMLFGVVRQYLLAWLGRRIDLNLMAGYSRHILGLPLNFFEMRRVGEILSRVNDAAKISDAVGGVTLTAIVDGTLVVFVSALLWCYDPPLALVATLFVPLLLGSVLLHHPAARKRSRQAMEHGAQYSAHLVEDVSGVETIKAFNAEPLRTDQGEDRLVKVVQSGFSLQKLGVSMGSASLLVTAVAGIVVLWYGGHRVMAGALTIGELMFFHTLLASLLGPLERLASVNLKLQDALVAVDRLFQVMDVEVEETPDRRRANFTGVRDAIELRDVSFQYGCRDKVLRDVNLKIPAGSTVAIVGESGSGKSTLLKLLMRFYSPTEGQLLADGVDARDFELASWRSRIGLVSQDPFIFNGTVRDNIALGRPNADMADVIAAARDAGLEEFISRLPERYDTVIGERGANLSGGQRQRLAIARALLRKPDVLIFDEATSHLDTATERAIQESLRDHLADKTVILVAHRLSTIRQADRIYVMRDGEISESGSHEELLKQGESYAELWHAQTDRRERACPAMAVA
jgi:ATP-binding cassette, subfamily C, bacteriocin exporter